MRIALVNPMARRSEGYHRIGSFIPELGLQVLAEMVPAPHEVDIIDEVFDATASDKYITPGRYDLVGLTAYTSGATRAYEIAGRCRSLGIPTIIGGPHVSAMPEEAAEHFDSVAVGECDEIWPGIIADADAGTLKKRYQGGLPELRSGIGRAAQQAQPINGTYSVSCIQTSRGCPVGCEYCSVTQFNGAPIRRRPIPEVVEEWFETPKPFLFVVDDNFFGVGEEHAKWAKELLRAIIREQKIRRKKKLWFSQTTINMGDDPEGLALAYKAGCRGMMVGFETFNRKNLEEYHKGINKKNLDRYPDLIRGFHRQGVSVFGGFIIGAEQDDQDTVADTAELAISAGVDIIQITNLTPLPGTKMYDRFVEQGRIFALNYPEDWERYSFVETVYRPSRMTAGQLDEAIYELRYLAAKMPWVWGRTLKTLWRTRSWQTALFVHGMNIGFKRMARIQTPRDEERFGFTPNGSERTRRMRQAFRFFTGRPVKTLASAESSA